MEDINGDINKSSSQDIISRDTGKKELPMITLFCIRLQYSALIFYHRQRETRKWYNVVLASGSEKHHVIDASSDIKTKGKFLKIDDQGLFGFCILQQTFLKADFIMHLVSKAWKCRIRSIHREVFCKIDLWHERVDFKVTMQVPLLSLY